MSSQVQFLSLNPHNQSTRCRDNSQRNQLLGLQFSTYCVTRADDVCPTIVLIFEWQWSANLQLSALKEAKWGVEWMKDIESVNRLMLNTTCTRRRSPESALSTRSSTCSCTLSSNHFLNVYSDRFPPLRTTNWIAWNWIMSCVRGFVMITK